MKAGTRRLLLPVGVFSVLAGLATVAILQFRTTNQPQTSRGNSAPVNPQTRGRDASARTGFAQDFHLHVAALRQASHYENVVKPTPSTGSDSCALCHEAIAERYFLTGMGQSLNLQTPELAPPDAVIHDGFSPRSYRVVNRDGVMWHQELLSAASSVSDDGHSENKVPEIVLSEHPVKWQIGSGHHSRSYLIEIDGLLIESPVTWYSSRQAWGMSPGFDHPGQPSFARIAEAGCLYCHAGDASPMDGSSNRLTIHEGAIGCERCHGPGQLHVTRREAKRNHGVATASSSASYDESIVNPRHLDRELSDSICGQCHLRSAATVLVPGARLDDFQPGMNLADFRTDYRFVPGSQAGSSTGSNRRSATRERNDSMTVVGHIEQLQSSRCYQHSELSCTSCHDPHGGVSPEERVTHYRSACLQCHPANDCHVSEGELQERSPDNDCTVCHMPRSGTDIPHLTFTHHRIGLHSRRSSEQQNPSQPARQHPPGVLEPLTDSRFIPLHVKEAMLGLAYLEFSGRADGLPHAQEYQRRAYQLLSQAWLQGERSPELASALVALGAEQDLPLLAEATEAALKRPEITGAMRVNFLLSQAFSLADRNRFSEAASLFDDVVTIRRSSADWQLLGDFRQAAGEPGKAAEAFEQALQISPLNLQARQWLVDYYLKANDHAKAKQHKTILSLIQPASRQQSRGR